MELNKELLEDGDIVLFHDKWYNPMAWAIRTLTESYWNHVGVYHLDISNQQGYIVEALTTGVAKTPISKYENNPRYDYKVIRAKLEAFNNLSEYKLGLAKAMVYIMRSVGKKYDFGAIAWLAIIFLARSFVKKFNKSKKQLKFNPLESRYRFFCSELVCQAHYGISLKHPFLFAGKTRQKCDTTTPKDIAKSENCFLVQGVDEI